MEAREFQTVVFVGSPSSDIDDVGIIEAEIAIRWFVPRRRLVTEDFIDVNGNITKGTKARRFFEVITMPFKTVSRYSEGDYMDFGDFARLESILLGTDKDGATKYPYRFIRAVYKSGNVHASGRIERAGEHSVGVDGGNDFFNGWFPMQIALDGEDLGLKPASGGKSDLEFTISEVGLI